MVTFIDQHREVYGVEPICAVLPIAPSTYCLRKAQQRDATKQSARSRRDEELRAAIQRVWDAHDRLYGAENVWRQLRRDGIRVARCTVERLMRVLGLRGTVRGRAWTITTHAEPHGVRRLMLRVPLIALVGRCMVPEAGPVTDRPHPKSAWGGEVGDRPALKHARAPAALDSALIRPARIRGAGGPLWPPFPMTPSRCSSRSASSNGH
jgi:putative transposase